MSLTDRAAGARAPTTGRIGKGGPAAGRDDLRIFLVAGEHSGDALGGKLMSALTAQCKGRIHFLGVGGEDMERAGLASQFPLADVAVMGLASIMARLPRIMSRVYRTVDAAVAADLASVISAAAAAHLAGIAVIGRTPGDLAHGIAFADRNGLFLIAASAGGTP